MPPLAPISVSLRALQSFPDALDATVAALRELVAARWLVCARARWP